MPKSPGTIPAAELASNALYVAGLVTFTAGWHHSTPLTVAGGALVLASFVAEWHATQLRKRRNSSADSHPATG